MGWLLAVAPLFVGAAAYPSLLTNCRGWEPGGVGYMAVPSLMDGAGGDCVVNTDEVPAGGYVPGTTYNIKVTSSQPAIYKFHSEDGLCLGEDFPSASANEASFAWTAPDTDSYNVTLYALCGRGYSTLHAAVPVRLCPSGNCASAVAYVAPTPAPTPAPMPAPVGGSTPAAVGAAADIALGETGISLSFERVGIDRIRFRLTLSVDTWLGFGLAAGNVVSMSGSGQGSDIVTCAGGEAVRHWITGRDIPSSSGETVPGSVCERVNGQTSLTFERDVAAGGGTELAVTPGTDQQIIFARGSDGATASAYHGGGSKKRGGMVIDFATGSSSTSAKRSGEALLYLHLALMSLAWGGCLPLGVAIANRFRANPAWFTWHRRLQVTGWLLQLVGFAMAVWYCQEFSSHFNSLHTWIGLLVVILGTLQPLNAALRPHLEAGQVKTTARRAFEVVHRGCGWMAVVFGMLNVLAGIWVAAERGYDAVTIGVAATLAAVCLTVPIGAFSVGFCCPGKAPLSSCVTPASIQGETIGAGAAGGD